MLVYQFSMQVDSKTVGSFIGSLTGVTSEGKNQRYGLLEAGEKGDSSSLSQFLSYVQKHKDGSQTFSIRWKPSDKNKGKFQNLKKDTFRLRLDLKLVNENGAARWKDFAEIKNASVKNVTIDARDNQEWVEINYAPRSMEWSEEIKDQRE